MNVSIRNRKLLNIILFIISIFYLLLYLRPSVIDFDENYTLALVRHSYSKVIYLDSMDVHPPLYYLLVKLFIQMTTFWTSYLPIKILSARLFSIIVTVISFIVLRKIISYFHVNNNIVIQWICLLLLPNVLGVKFQFQQLTDIRMYSLAAMFIIIEFYYLMKFDNRVANKYIFMIIISAILAEYTHYYAAMFSGILLFLFFLKSLFENNKRKSLQLLSLGIVFGISFLPWVKVVAHQISNSTNYWITPTLEIKDILIFIFIILLFIYPLYKFFHVSYNKCVYFEMILCDLLIVFIFSMLYGILKNPIYQVRYMYPLLIIYEFLGINVIIKYMCLSKYKTYCLIVISLLLFNMVGSSFYQIGCINKYSIESIKLYNDWHSSKYGKIIINHYSNNRYKSNIYLLNMSNINKRIIISRNVKKKCPIYNNKAYIYTFNSLIKRTHLK